MSLILDALKKADQERKEEHAVPSIDATHPNTRAAYSNQRKYIIIAAISFIAVIVLLIVLVFMLFSQKNDQSNTQISMDTSASQGAALSSNALRNAPEPNQTQGQNNTNAQVYIEPPSGDTSEQKQVANAQTNNLSEQQRKLIEAQYNDSPNTRPKNENVSGLYQEPSDETTQDTETQQSITERNTPAQENIATEAKVITIDLDAISGYPSISFIKDLPISSQKDIPTLMYTAHYYRDNGDSYIVINDREIRENGNIQAAIRVTKILKDGVLLSSGNNKFKMRARNSWLNY